MVSARSYLCDGSRCVSAGLTVDGTGSCHRDAALGGSTGSQFLTSPRRRASLARLRHWAATSRPRPPPFARCRRASSPPCAQGASQRWDQPVCGSGAVTGSSGPAGHIWAKVFSLVRRSSQSSCVLSNWDTPKACPITLPRGSRFSGLQSVPMRGRLRLWSTVQDLERPGTGSRQAAAP